MKSDKIENAIKELLDYMEKFNIQYENINESKHFLTFKQFLFEQKLNEITDKLTDMEIEEYQIDSIVFEKKFVPEFTEHGLILEWEQYKKIPKTNLTYRFDSENTNTKTQDHIHVFQSNNQLYAINIDGSAHDGSKARLGKKEIKFLKGIGFTPPADGLLEWITLPTEKEYVGYRFYLLFD
jgi:hypothetical protein